MCKCQFSCTEPGFCTMSEIIKVLENVLTLTAVDSWYAACMNYTQKLKREFIILNYNYSSKIRNQSGTTSWNTNIITKTTVNITIHCKKTYLTLFNDSVSSVEHGIRWKDFHEW